MLVLIPTASRLIFPENATVANCYIIVGVPIKKDELPAPPALLPPAPIAAAPILADKNKKRKR